MEMHVDTGPVEAGWRVNLRVALERREASELYLAGDALISWPTEGMRSTGVAGPVARSSMFLSEIIARQTGLELTYDSEDLANRAAQILAYQVRAALPDDRGGGDSGDR